MGKDKIALLLSGLLLSGCYGDNSLGLSPHNPPTKVIGVTAQDLKQQDIQIAEAKKLTRELEAKENAKKQKKLKSHFYWDVPIGHDLQDYISKLCQQYGISEQLAYAVMKTESNFNPNMISTTSDYGLFQINETNFESLRSELGITNFLDPYQNAHAGIYMLGNLRKQYVYENIVLMSYNGGIGYMKSLTSRGVFTTDYTQKVSQNKSKIVEEKR